MTAKIIEIIIMESIAVMMFILAYLIGAKGRMELIAGYNRRSADRVYDKPGLRRLITRLCALLGLGTAIMPLMTYFSSATIYGIAYCIGGYGGFIIGLTAFTVLQAREYTN